MEQEKKSPENQGGFFDQLMFGTRSIPENEEETQITNDPDESNENNAESNNPDSNQEKSQIEYIIEIAQVVGPYLSKLSPMLSNLQSLISNKNKGD